MPLFVSRRRLNRRVVLPTAKVEWALDSGGFTELSMYGKWQTSASQYIDEIYGYETRIGRLAWAAPQDWMCEPAILNQTGLTVDDHQWATVDNYLLLRSLAKLHGLHTPIVPVLQGWTLDDYHYCWEMYDQAGIDLLAEPLVGLGSVCRRQNTDEIHEIASYFYETGMRLHGFGVKTRGFKRYAWALESADSMAWSYRARRAGVPLMEGCTHKACNNCLLWAEAWGRRTARLAGEARQQTTFSTRGRKW